LTEKEKAAVFKQYGNEEAAARAYETWNSAEKPQTLFQKIMDFFRRIAENFWPTAAGTFGKVKSGEVWGREGKLPAGIAPAKYRVVEGTEAVLEQYHRDTLAQSTQKSLWRRFWDGDPALKESWRELKEKVYDQVVDRYAPGGAGPGEAGQGGDQPAPGGSAGRVPFSSGSCTGLAPCEYGAGIVLSASLWNHEAVLGEGSYHDPVVTTGAGGSLYPYRWGYGYGLPCPYRKEKSRG